MVGKRWPKRSRPVASSQRWSTPCRPSARPWPGSPRRGAPARRRTARRRRRAAGRRGPAAPPTAAAGASPGGAARSGGTGRTRRRPTATPARSAMAMPSPVASAGLVVTAKSWPAPPVASTTWSARTATRTRRRGRERGTPTQRPPSTRRSRANQRSRTAPALRQWRRRGPARPRRRWRRRRRGRPGPGVATLAGSASEPGGLAVEHGAEGDELVDPGRAFVDEDAHGVVVAEAGTGGQGVGQVEVGRVLVAAEHGGDAALGPAGGGLASRPW